MKWRKVLLMSGILASLLYPLTDILAGNLYKGYSFHEQTVSELFAMGAPTGPMVVTLFSVSSILFITFALGIWLSAGESRLLRALSLMILGSAVNGLILWNIFPMHMRGVPPTITDTMHGVFAVNPFVLISLVLGAVYFKNWFRLYSIGTILLVLITAILGIPKALLVYENQPTPGLGVIERVSQYGHQLWHAMLAIILLSRQNTRTPGKFSS